MPTAGKRQAIEDIRRTELILAAHRVFMAHGLGGMTTARICKEAGMSPGILAYYFKGKDEVLFGMVRYNNRLLMADIVARLRRAVTPWERLLAIVEGNFPRGVFKRDAANAWVSVCAAAASDPKYGQLQRIFYKRLGSNLASALGGVLPADRLRQAVLGIGVMIDGLWLRKAADDRIAPQMAVETVIAYVESFLTQKEIAILRAGPDNSSSR
jgi:transcriptional repressor BetI